MAKKYSSLIFDLDGTLLDSEIRNAFSLLTILHRKAQLTHLTIEDITPKMGRTGVIILKEFNIPDEEINDYLREWTEAVYNESQKPMELFKGVLPLLEELQKKEIPCGIVSSKSKEIFEIENQHFNLKPYFHHIILADDTPLHKPHPAPLLEYLNRSSLKADECLYIGDTYSDFLCAQDSNVDFGLALWGAAKVLEEDILTFHHPEDILTLYSDTN